MRSQAADREQSLRDGGGQHGKVPGRKHNSSIQERRQTGKRATKQRLPQIPAQRGGWNASSTYEGTAVVQGQAFKSAHRHPQTPIMAACTDASAGSAELESRCSQRFPCVVASQITVLEYTKGGKLPDAEGAK